MDAAAAAGQVPDPEPVRAPRLGGRSTLWSGVITLAVLVVMATQIDVREVGRELAGCDWRLVLLGALAHYASYVVRGARWRRSLRHLHREGSYARFSLLVFFYNFVDNVVPAKLGDVYGAHLAKVNLGVPRAAALGSILFQRMVDAWFVLLLAVLSTSLLFHEHLPDAVFWALAGGLAIAVLASGVMLASLLLRRFPLQRLPQAIRVRLASFHLGLWPRPRELPTIAVLTIAIWALESLWVWLLLAGFGVQPGWVELLFVTTIPLLATSFPLTPSGAGVVELSLYGCLRAIGPGQALAASITLVNRLLDFWLHILLGTLIWALRGRLGLRTWREVGLEPREGAAPELSFEPRPREGELTCESRAL